LGHCELDAEYLDLLFLKKNNKGYYHLTLLAMKIDFLLNSNEVTLNFVVISVKKIMCSIHIKKCGNFIFYVVIP